MNDQQIEQEILDKGLTAPRVTPDDIEANIASEHYFTAQQGAYAAAMHRVLDQGGIITSKDAAPPPNALGLLTFCVLVLRNGFTVTGESACASPENFDSELGRKIARANAVQKIWPLMGYALKERLHREALGDKNDYAAEQLRWHAELKNALLDKLQISDPSAILARIDHLLQERN